MEHFVDALKRYADFTGRATRTQYWMFVLFYAIAYIALLSIDLALGTGVLALIYSLALAIPHLAISARRLHDTGRSGWWQLLALIPLIGAIVLIVFLATDSEPDNRFGPNLKKADTVIA